jgi:hypothetical protein
MPEYSISQLGKFEGCALHYKFIYVDGIKRYEEGVEAFLGQRFHDAMEWLYKERAFRVVPLEELLEYYEKDWAKTWHAEVKINRKKRTSARIGTCARSRNTWSRLMSAPKSAIR